MSDFTNRLIDFLRSRDLSEEFRSLTQDASTREYFRVNRASGSAIACVYPEAFDPAEHSYLDVTSLFRAAGLPVAEIYDVDGHLGVILLEDFGDLVLRDAMAGADSDTRNAMLDTAIKLIPRIQSATSIACEMGSVASKLRFDQEKLVWELEFFKKHYFETFLRKSLDEQTTSALLAEFAALGAELEKRAAVLCHRDFHTANLMVTADDDLKIIDHQDARIGSVTYDLVSLLLDRIIEPPSSEWLAQKQALFLGVREDIGLKPTDPVSFAEEFRLQTVQRCLKAAGTFSYQSAVRGKTYFIPYIKPMFRIVLKTLDQLDQFPMLRKILEQEV